MGQAKYWAVVDRMRTIEERDMRAKDRVQRRDNNRGQAQESRGQGMRQENKSG